MAVNIPGRFDAVHGLLPLKPWPTMAGVPSTIKQEERGRSFLLYLEQEFSGLPLSQERAGVEE